MSSIELPQRDDLMIEVSTRVDEARHDIELRQEPAGDEPTVEFDQRPEPTVVPARKRRGGRPSGKAATILWSIATITGLALWFLFHALVMTPLQERGSQARLYAQFREELAEATAPLGGVIQPGKPVAVIDVGVRGLRDLVVVEGTTGAQLTAGPGHLANSALPGQIGVSVIMGRSVTYGAPFRGLSKLHPNDTIIVTTGQGRFTYGVDRLRRSGDPLPPLPASNSRLTLLTSEASGWRSGWAPDHVIYLDASLTGRAQPAPPGRPVATFKSARPMGSDSGALVILVFWLQGLVLVGGGLVWAWMRWGRWQTWLVGWPLALALFWGASGAALRLLPNLV